MNVLDGLVLDEESARDVSERARRWYHRIDIDRLPLFSSNSPIDDTIRQRAQDDGPFYTHIFAQPLEKQPANPSPRRDGYVVWGIFVDSNGDDRIYIWNPLKEVFQTYEGERLE